MPAQNRRRRFETQLIFAAPPPLPVPPLPVAPLAAAFSDAAVALALAPLDTLATRRHIRPHSPGGAPSAMPAFRPFDAAAPAAAAAALDALAFVALYRFGRSALRRLRTDVAPRAVPLDTSRIAKEASPSPSSRSGEAVDAFVAGGAASVFTAILTTPATAAVRRMRVGGSSGSVLKGVRGLFCGVHATVARDLPFDALEFTVFEAFQRSVRKMRRSAFHGPSGRRSDMIVKISDPVLEALESVVAGAVTGAIVAAVVAPLDLCVRCRDGSLWFPLFCSLYITFKWLSSIFLKSSSAGNFYPFAQVLTTFFCICRHLPGYTHGCRPARLWRRLVWMY